MSFPRYPAYKDSGVEWLGEVPDHWEVVRLKQACEVFPSNVDKHSRDDEPPVLLCNYTDVYYNEKITQDITFMSATATREQIARFKLKAGDTIITKDSETADDIAISAYVPRDLPGVVCGYHLSMIRPRSAVCGAFVKRLFDSGYLKSKVAVAANGLTRVGLGQYAIDNLEVPLPPEAEQVLVSSFLDDETAKIDALVAEQERLIELLKEKRQAVISHAVTKGLDPSAPMKDSGVEWLGEVPAHWEVTRLGWIASDINDINHEMPDAVSEGVPFLSAKDLDDFGNLSFDGDVKMISEDDFLRLSKKICPRKGDIIYSRIGTIGRAAIVKSDLRFLVSYSCCVIRIQRSDVVLDFLRDLLSSDLILTESKMRIRSMGQPDLGLGEIRRFPIPLPPVDEQEAIDSFLKHEVGSIDKLISAALRVINLATERRTALISAAVTGQIDVRGLASCEAAA